MLFGGIIGKLQSEGVLGGYWDSYSRSFHDWSGNGNNGAPSNLYWESSVWKQNGFNSVVIIDDATLIPDPAIGYTLVALPRGRLTIGVFISRAGAGGNSFQFRTYLGRVYLDCAGGASRTIGTFDVSRDDIDYLAVSTIPDNISNPSFYLNGVLFETPANPVGWYNTSIDAFRLMASRTLGTRAERQRGALVILRPLTAQEHWELFTQLQEMK